MSRGHWAGGVWVAMVTPWHRRRGILEEAIDALIERFVAAGVSGLFILGTTGEGTLLSPEERMAFAEAVVARSRGRLPVIVHAGHDIPRLAAELARHARDTGAVAVAVAPPTRYRLEGEELFSHYAYLADAVGDYPLLLYDIPSTTRNPLGGALLARLHDSHANVVGAKVSRSDWEGWRGYLAVAEGLAVFVGNDEMIYPLLLMGAAGLVSGLANLFPSLYVELYSASVRGDLPRAREIQRLVWRLCDVCHGASPLAYVKRGLEILGVPAGKPLPPLRDLSPDEIRELERNLREVQRAEAGIMAKGGENRSESFFSKPTTQRR